MGNTDDCLTLDLILFRIELLSFGNLSESDVVMGNIPEKDLRSLYLISLLTQTLTNQCCFVFQVYFIRLHFVYVQVFNGEVDMAIGGDQGGSIRIPASWCGVVGLKPTWGLVPYTGAVHVEITLDHLGPMATTVNDCAILLEVSANCFPIILTPFEIYINLLTLLILYSAPTKFN